MTLPFRGSDEAIWMLKQRQQLAEDGIITVAVAVGWDGKLMARPQMHLNGVVSAVEVSLLENLVVKRVESCLADRWTQFARSFESGQIDVDWTGLQIEFEQAIQRLVRQELRQSNPSIVIMLQSPVAGNNGRSAGNSSAVGSAAASQEAPGRRRQRSTAKVGS